MSEIFSGTPVFSIGFAEKRLIGKEWNDVQWNRHHHQIQYHRLYLPLTGKAKLHLFDRAVDLLPGNIYFIPAFSIRQSEIEGKMEKYYIHFQTESPIFDLYRYLSGRVSCPADEMSEALFATVVRNFSANTQEAYLRVQGAMNLLLSGFLAGMDADRRGVLRFSPVLNYIGEHYKENIRLSDLSALMNISTMYFANAFKATFHISPKQFILNRRLTESQRLLLETDLSVKEIAYAVGFENEGYFSEFFSAKVGVPAAKFRRRDVPTTRGSVL